jgi:putative peptidoglycan lipid II flippase
MQVPVAVVGQALATAALPTLARLHSEGRRDELDSLVLGTLKAGIAVGVLGGAATWALADPLVSTVYRHGAFDAGASTRVIEALRIFAFAVPAWIAQQIAVRPFYARGDTWRPMLLGSLVALCAIPLYLRFAASGPAGLATAGAFAISVNALATLALARWIHGAPSLGGLGLSVLRAIVVALAAALAASAALPGQAELAGSLLDLAVGGVVFLAVATLGVVLLADAPTREAWLGLLRGLLERLRGSPRL